MWWWLKPIGIQSDKFNYLVTFLSMPFVCSLCLLVGRPHTLSTETLHRLHQWRPTIINLSPTPENNKKQQMKIKEGNSSEEHFSPSQLVTWWWKRRRRRKEESLQHFSLGGKHIGRDFSDFPFSFCCCSFDSFRSRILFSFHPSILCCYTASIQSADETMIYHKSKKENVQRKKKWFGIWMESEINEMNNKNRRWNTSEQQKKEEKTALG